MWTRDQAEHFWRRFHVFGQTFAFQSGLQGLAVATGLVIIHAITKEEYGLYAIVASIQGMAAVLSDSGIGSAVTSQLGRTWQDRDANLGVVLTGLKERQRLLAGTLPICALMMIVIAGGKTSTTNLVAMELAMVCCVYFEVGTYLYQLVPLYTGKRAELQILQMILGAGRIVSIVALAWLYKINIIALLTINVLYGFATLYFIRKLVVGTEPSKPIFHPGLQREIHQSILRLLPTCAFYAFQGQITTYIISLFGQLVDVASVAALGRIGLLFGLLLNVLAMLGAPAFSKAHNKAEGLRIFWGIVGTLTLFSLAIFVASLLIPGLMLEILGKNYTSLTVELQITVITTGLSSLAGGIWALLSARGLVGLGWIYIVVTLVVQIAYASVGDLHTVRGVLWFGMATAAAHLLNMAIQAYWLILRPKELGRNQ